MRHIILSKITYQKLGWKTLPIALLSLTVGCTTVPHQKSSVNQLAISPVMAESSAYFVVSQSKSLLPCQAAEPFNESIKFALQAADRAQLAKTPEDWQEVANLWAQAVAWMQSVPIGSSRRAFAEKKVAEYMRNLAYSQQQSIVGIDFNYPSFSSYLLNHQLQLYLSYVAAVGPPDVLIVGSSRALMGVDPRHLKAALSKRGYPNLKIFNFGVNGATAQVVDFQLRQLLTNDQLPKMIIWADGVRAFNSGRVDKTFNSIANSEGNKLLSQGKRPQLLDINVTGLNTCLSLPNQVCKLTDHPPDQLELNLALNLAATETTIPLAEVVVSNQNKSPMMMTETEIADAIDAQGFLPRFTKFNPRSYYQERPYVAGVHDRDYSDFSLEGKQASALNKIINFTKSRRIPLVIVNLPLTDEYLDKTRWNAEQKFQQKMANLAKNQGFTWVDLSVKWEDRHDYFIDPSHLNRYGAIAVSRQLAIEPQINWPKSK